MIHSIFARIYTLMNNIFKRVYEIQLKGTSFKKDLPNFG